MTEELETPTIPETPEYALNQRKVLNLAIAISGGYMPVAEAVLTALPSVSPDIDGALRAMAYRMALYNGGQPDAELIISVIMNSTWEQIGITGATPLDTTNRAAIIGVIMSVAKSIITQQGNDLMTVAGLDTSFPAEPDPEAAPE